MTHHALLKLQIQLALMRPDGRVEFDLKWFVDQGLLIGDARLRLNTMNRARPPTHRSGRRRDRREFGQVAIVGDLLQVG